jgi:hypothetical protein
MLLKMFTQRYNRSGAKFKKMERAGLPTRDVLLLCMFALTKDERKLQYSRSNIQ